MSTPSNEQLEAFAKGLAKGMTIKGAAEAAGYSTKTTSYGKWPRREKFKARIARHLEAMADEASTTSLVPVIRRLLQAADAAVADPNGPTLRAACDLLVEAARLKQLLPAQTPARRQWPHFDMPHDEWMAIFAPREALAGPAD